MCQTVILTFKVKINASDKYWIRYNYYIDLQVHYI